MKTLTRQDFVEALIENDPSMTILLAKEAAEDVIQQMKISIFNRINILIKNSGRISIVVKSARIGRNPKTGEQHVIAPRHSITVSTSRKTVNKETFGKMDLIDDLKYLGYNKRSKAISEVFYNFIGKVMDGQHRVEIRGLGVFYPKVLPAGRKVRNPKTGEVLFAKEQIKLAFKCSSSLRKAVDKKYL